MPRELIPSIKNRALNVEAGGELAALPICGVGNFDERSDSQRLIAALVEKFREVTTQVACGIIAPGPLPDTSLAN